MARAERQTFDSQVIIMIYGHFADSHFGVTGFCVKMQKKNVLNAVRHSRSVEDNFASQEAFL